MIVPNPWIFETVLKKVTTFDAGSVAKLLIRLVSLAISRINWISKGLRVIFACWLGPEKVVLREVEALGSRKPTPQKGSERI